MGCSASQYEQEYKEFVNGELFKAKVLFDELGFDGPTSKSAHALFKCFEKLDKDSGGSVSFSEFAEFFRLDKNPFTERCFMLLDRAATGEINFPQFVMCTWNYCSHDRMGLTRFAYTLYDLEGTGNIPIEHLFSLVEDMYDIHGKSAASDGTGMNLIKNSPEYNCNRVKLLIKNAAGADAMMQLDEFIQFVRKTPTLLSVAFGIQSKLQAEVCGVSFWNKQSNTRKGKTTIGGKTVNMFDIDEVVHAFEEQYPDLLTNKTKKKSELGYSKKRNKDGSRTSGGDGGGNTPKRKKGKGGKYRPQMQLPDGEFNVKTSSYEERSQEKQRPPRPKKYNASTKRRRQQAVGAVQPDGKEYPKRGKLRKLKRHNSAKKLQAAYRGTVARKNLPSEQKQKALDRRKRLSVKGKKEGSTVVGKRKRTKLARKKSLQSPKGRGAASFF